MSDAFAQRLYPERDAVVYFSYPQLPAGTFDLVLRTDGDPSSLAGAVRDRAARVNDDVPLFNIAPLSDAVAQQTALARLSSFLLGVFGALALVLAAVGLYGVLAFVVRGRRREIAIRMAMGAEPRQILRMFVRQGLILVGAGLAVGALTALIGGRYLAATLYQVRATDPLVLAVTSTVLLAVAATASWLPARQATRVDPNSVLGE